MIVTNIFLAVDDKHFRYLNVFILLLRELFSSELGL